MKTIYLATDGGRAEMAYNTFNEALDKCLEMANNRRDEHFKPYIDAEKYKEKSCIQIQELNKEGVLRGYAFFIHNFYVMTVSYLE